MLGSELAKAGDPASAEQAFAMYRALSPNGDFAEDALSRQVDMAAEQGNLEHAKKLATQYLKEFPDGPRTADIEARIEQWDREQPSPPRVEEGASAASGAPDASTLR
jgi:TolA-binding protein